MITYDDLQEAIAECQGVRNPTASTALKLAAFYTIQDHLFGGDAKRDENASLMRGSPSAYSPRDYSFASAPDSNAETLNYSSGTDFAGVSSGKKTNDVMRVIDELMELLRGINRPLYNAVLRKIEDL